MSKKFPDDLRHIVWRTTLNNPEAEKEYASLIRTDRILTVSNYEMKVLQDTRSFVSKYVSEALFDTMMITCM